MISISAFRQVVLPVPGPPVRIETGWVSAVSIAFCVWIFAAGGGDPALTAFARAESALARSEFRLALENYSEAIARDPTMTAAYAGRGKCRLELSQHQEAVSDFQAADRLGDESAPAYVEMAQGTICLDKQDFEQAEAHFTRAIELDLNDSRLFSRRGVAKASLGNDRGAIEDLNVALTMDPNPVDYRIRGGCHYNLGNYHLQCNKRHDICGKGQFSQLGGGLQVGCGKRGPHRWQV